MNKDEALAIAVLHSTDEVKGVMHEIYDRIKEVAKLGEFYVYYDLHEINKTQFKDVAFRLLEEGYTLNIENKLLRIEW